MVNVQSKEIMNIDEIMNVLSIKNEVYLSLLNEIEAEKDMDLCSICYNLNNDSSVLLKCGHKFHEECLRHDSMKHLMVICPYCNQSCMLTQIEKKCCITLKSGKNKGMKCGKTCFNEKSLCGNHLNMKFNMKKTNFCQATIKSGKNKGKKCGAKCIDTFCKRHS